MIKELTAYYQQKGISALDFHCQHLQACSKGNERFVEAKEAFVGTEYEKGTIPRLLFVSLDPGSSYSDPKWRTVEFVRNLEEHKCDVAKLHKSRHWYRTHELAWILLKKLKPDLQIEDSHMQFLMKNRKVLWFHTYHPSNYGKFNQQRNECFEKWAEIIYDKFSSYR